MANKKTYDSLDVVKWVSALLIVIIHTNPFHGSELLEFYTKDVISRIAVPPVLRHFRLPVLPKNHIREWKNCTITAELYLSVSLCKAFNPYIPRCLLVLSAVQNPPVVFNRLVGTPCAERLSGQFLSLQFRISPLVYPCINIRHHPVLYFAHFYQN